MILDVLKILLFALIFLYITNWFQIHAFVIAFLQPRKRITMIKDEWIFKLVKQKTGLTLKRIIIFETNKLFGMMPSIPLKPELILSRGLYESFNKDEMEWVILHEAGHCVLWHTIKALVIELCFLFLGIFAITIVRLDSISSFLLSIFLSLLCIQVLRRFIEFEADKFSIERVSNPKGVITAQDKFKNAKDKNMFSSEKSIGRILLHWNILPSERIRMAKMRLNLN